MKNPIVNSDVSFIERKKKIMGRTTSRMEKVAIAIDKRFEGNVKMANNNAKGMNMYL